MINFPNSILEDGKEILLGFSIDLSKNSPTILKALNIVKSFRSKKAVNNVSLEVKQGEIIGLLGPNGAGKSTFLKILSGDLEPNSGSVNIEPGKRLSVLEQNHNIYDNHSVLDTVLMGNKKLIEIKNKMEVLY